MLMVENRVAKEIILHQQKQRMFFLLVVLETDHQRRNSEHGRIFIKDNDQDYLLMTDKNVIIAAGSSFTELLGPNIINVPLSILVEDRKQLTNILNTINTPTTRSSNHSLNFYSTTSKNSQ